MFKLFIYKCNFTCTDMPVSLQFFLLKLKIGSWDRLISKWLNAMDQLNTTYFDSQEKKKKRETGL